jgi:hypothetical protein
VWIPSRREDGHRSTFTFQWEFREMNALPVGHCVS